jgi:hypothetical protein
MGYGYEDDIDYRALEEYEERKHQEADKKYPYLEDRYCSDCGRRLVRGSVSYYEGRHIDSCV